MLRKQLLAFPGANSHCFPSAMKAPCTCAQVPVLVLSPWAAFHILSGILEQTQGINLKSGFGIDPHNRLQLSG